MFFTCATRILSILELVSGFGGVLVGLSVASGWTGLPYDVALAHYAPGHSSSGEVIDRERLEIIIAVALGTLAEIGFALRKKHN
jgi:hypothetical protein